MRTSKAAKALIKSQLKLYLKVSGGSLPEDLDYKSRLMVPLQAFRSCRQWREGESVFAAQVLEVQRWQTERVLSTHKAILKDPNSAAAARFLLLDAYQGSDLVQVFDQIDHLIPYLVKLFPEKILSTIEQLLHLNLITAQMDEALAVVLFEKKQLSSITEASYIEAFLEIGGVEWRFDQLDLMTQLITSIESYVKSPWLMRVFKLAKGPAYSANFDTLYDFLMNALSTLTLIEQPAVFAESILVVERRINQNIFDCVKAPFVMSDFKGLQSAKQA